MEIMKSRKGKKQVVFPKRSPCALGVNSTTLGGMLCVYFHFMDKESEDRRKGWGGGAGLQIL